MEQSYLLPTTVVPVHYDTALRIDLEKLCFSGEESITVKVASPVRVVRLHSLNLSVSNVSLCSGDLCVQAEVTTDIKTQTIDLKLAQEVPAGEAVLHLSFEAPLGDQLEGLYKSKYKGLDGADRWMAVTQFESTYARYCFPCWDEPERKATFTITLNVPKDRTTLSNMPEDTSEEDPYDATRRIVKFQKSPIMSTYLVAIVVGEYDYVENILESGTMVRVFTPKGLSHQGKFALDVASRALKYYSDYFKMSYPLPKMDLITVTDFSAGAMENWGLVTYRESLLLSDPVTSSARNNQVVVEIVSHELAHQWFGNLVTMKWWTHLWLNEGYASFTQALCADHLFPEYQIWTQFMSSSFIRALDLDGLESTHPIEVDIGSADEVEEIFDDISYHKGASVIRMLHRYLGDENFRRGMILYLERHQYSNTATEDLWRALEEASHKPVSKVMTAWTRNPGFPMVSVEVEHTDEKSILTLSQTRFFLNGKLDDSGSIWLVPIDIICSVDNEVRSVLLEGYSTKIVLPLLPEDGWVKVNCGACGFYRTKYSDDLLKRLMPPVSSHALVPLDRINILDDLLAMVKAGHSTTVQLLEVLQGYSSEDDYSVFLTIRNCFKAISKLLSHNARGNKRILAPLVMRVFNKSYSKLGWQPIAGEHYLNNRLRPLILGMLGEHGEKSVVEKCSSLLEDHVSGNKIIAADMRACVYKTCMSVGDQEIFQKLKSIYQSSDSQEERVTISDCMGATDKTHVMEKVMKFCMDEIRSQDIPFVMGSMAGWSVEGSRFIWGYFREHCYAFTKMYGTGVLMIRLMQLVSKNFFSTADADEIHEYFSSVSEPFGMRGILQNLESIRLNAAWLARDGEAARQYLYGLQEE